MTECPPEKCLRILLAVLLLAHVESTRGDVEGSIFPHLRAGWHLVTQLLKPSGPHIKSMNADLEGFTIETFMYLTLVSKIVPDDARLNRAVADDQFMSNIGWIKEYGSFGTFFSYGLDLFEKIPIVCSLAKECLNHWRAVRNGQRQPSSSRVDQVEPDSHAPSPPNAPPAPPASISRRVTHLISWLEAWESPEPSAEAAQSKQGHRAAGEFYRQALLIYLKACCVEHAPDAFMGPSTVPNEGSEFWPLPSAKMLADIAGHTEIVMGLAPILGMSRYGATSLWPLIIASSCFTDEDKRALLIESMDNTASYFYGAAQLERVVNVAQILWRDEGRKAFGPYGLEMIMKEHAYNLSMS